MRTLDRSRPYAEIWGGAGHQHNEQDGLLFDLAGNLRPGQQETVAPRPRGRPPKVQAAPVVSAADEYSDLSDDELRTLVEVGGDTWRGRQAAIETLGGKA